MKRQDDVWTFPKLFSYVIFRISYHGKIIFQLPKNFNFMNNTLSLISRVLEIKWNQWIGLIDSRIHGCGQPGQQAQAAIQGAESICLATENCFSCLSASASSSTLWWSNSLTPDWARLNPTSMLAFVRTRWLWLLIKTTAWFLSWTPGLSAAICRVYVYIG